MKSVVVLASHPQFAESVKTALEPEGHRVVHRLSVEDAEPLLVHGLASACVVDVETPGVQGIWVAEKIRRFAPDCPIIVYSTSREQDWEEELYLLGVRHVLTKPVRARLLNKVLNEISFDVVAEPVKATTSTSTRSVEMPVSHAAPVGQAIVGTVRNSQELGILRQFSEILTHSLDSAALVKQFLNLLRELMGINRAAVFLKSSVGVAAQQEAGGPEPWMRAVCTIGLTPTLADHNDLKADSGIGAHLGRTGRILRRDSTEAADTEIQKEFELIGVEVAIPIVGGEELVGIAVFDRRVTGEPLLNSELELIFHLLEQVGMAISNIGLHSQLVRSNQLLGSVLRDLSSACVVVGPDLTVLHANKSARRLFGGASRRTGTLDFADLPEVLGGKVYQVIKTGAAVPAFRYETGEAGGNAVFSVSIAPIHEPDGGASRGGHSALTVLEDRTQAEQLQKLEVEASNLRLVRQMADRLAAEVGNAITPLSAHQQLLLEKYKDTEFRNSLNTALVEGVRRVTRLVSQMRYIYRDVGSATEEVALGPLIEEAYEDARRHHSGKSTRLICDDRVRVATVVGDRGALRHAFAEIILNALQANVNDSRVEVRLTDSPQDNGMNELAIEIEDNGEGFTPDAVKKATTPFYTTRSVGVGLGLTASRKIIETHRGHIEILPRTAASHGVVRVCLPSVSHSE